MIEPNYWVILVSYIFTLMILKLYIGPKPRVEFSLCSWDYSQSECVWFSFLNVKQQVKGSHVICVSR